MQTRFFGRVCAALVAISLLAVPVTALADDSGPVEWAGWISDSLQGLAVDYFATKEQLDNATWLPATIGSWSVEYVTSQEMAKDVRSLPEYQELYGSNPWDSSAAIRSYDGGDLVSILTPEGLYNAWMWLHGGVPPYDDSGGGDSNPLPNDSRLLIARVDSLSESGGSVSFTDGTVVSYGSSYGQYFNNTVAGGSYPYFVKGASSGGQSLTLYWSNSESHIFVVGSGSSNPSSLSAVKPVSGSAGLGVSSGVINGSLGSGSSSSTYLYLFGISSDPSNQISSDSFSNISRGPSSGSASYCPDGFYYYQTWSGNYYPYVYIITSSSAPVFAAGKYWDSLVGPAPAPDPVDPVAPSSPSVDAPQSDGPVQTDVNITVTLPDGSSTVVVAPSADLQPVVQWLSIINANIVAWGGNISQWLAEIWKTLDAFRMAVDNWSVSILSAIDSLGNVVPSFDTNEVNYWNTVITYNNDVWGTARNIGQQDIQNDLDRLKGKFPFSIPWDLYAILLLFDADPVAPVLDIPLVYSDGSVTSENIHVDLSAFDTVMSLWRRLSLVGFVFALAVATRRLLSYVTVANDLVFG